MASENTGLTEVRVGLVAPAYLYIPLWAAQHAGHLERHGIHATSQVLGVTDKVTTALMGGQLEIMVGSPEGVIGDAMSGGPMRILAGVTNKPPLSMIAQSRYKSLKDLRGAKIGTSSLKEGTRFLAQDMLEKGGGLKYPGDYEFALVGAHPVRWKCLQEDTIDAALQLIPYDRIAEDMGFSNLGPVETYIPEYAFTDICVRKNWAESNSDLVVRFLRAMLDAVDWLYAHPDETARIAEIESPTGIEYARRACRDIASKGTIPRDLRVSKAGLARAFETMQQCGVAPEKPVKKLEEVLDYSYLDRAAAMK